MKGLFRTPKKQDASKQSAASSNADDSDHRAEDNESALKTAEELFKASLQAKREEIAKLLETLKGVRAELFKEVRETSEKNEKLAQTEDEIQAKEEEVLKLRGTVRQLEHQLAALRDRYKLVCKGAQPPGGEAGGGDEWRDKDEETCAFRDRAETAERQAAELEGTVEVLRSALLQLWGAPPAPPAPPPPPPARDSEAVWEAAAVQQRNLVRELLSELRGKDDMLRQLRAT